VREVDERFKGWSTSTNESKRLTVEGRVTGGSDDE